MKYYRTSTEPMIELYDAVFSNTFGTFGLSNDGKTLNAMEYAYNIPGKCTTNTKETVFSIDMPGVKKEDIDVSIDTKKLKVDIVAKRKGYQDLTCSRQFADVKFGTPTCSLVDGVFTLTIPFEQEKENIIKIKP